jgi:hypothetical protein
VYTRAILPRNPRYIMLTMGQIVAMYQNMADTHPPFSNIKVYPARTPLASLHHFRFAQPPPYISFSVRARLLGRARPSSKTPVAPADHMPTLAR